MTKQGQDVNVGIFSLASWRDHQPHLMTACYGRGSLGTGSKNLGRDGKENGDSVEVLSEGYSPLVEVLCCPTHLHAHITGS